MRNPLYKRVFRMLRKAPGNYIPVFILMTLVIVFISAFFITQGSVKHLHYERLKDAKLEDGQFTALTPLDRDTVAEVERLDVRVYEHFYLEEHLTEYPVKNSDEDASPGDDSEEKRTLRIYKNREHINLPVFAEGRAPVKEDEIAVAEIMTKVNHLSVGDSVEVGGNRFTITGTFSVPDYTAILRHRTDFTADPAFFGLGLVSEDGFQRFDPNRIKFSYSYHTGEELTKEEAFEKLKEIYRVASERTVITDSVTAFDNSSINYLMNDMGGDVPMITTLLVLVLLSLSFLFTVQAKSLIEEEAPIIGTLLASGYASGEILKHYLLPPMFVTTSAAVIGNVLAYSGFYRIFSGMYYEFFSLPPFKPLFHPGAFLVTTLLPLSIIFFVNVLMLSSKLRISPLRFLRRELSRPKKKNRIRLNLPFMKAFRVRVLMDNKVNVFSLFFGLFIANILLVFGLSFEPIIDQFAEDTRSEMQYLHTYLLKYPFELSEEQKNKAEKGLIVNMDTYFEDDGVQEDEDGKVHEDKTRGADEEAKSFPYYGLHSGSKYQKLQDIDGRKEGEVIVSGGFLNKHGLKIGDTFTFSKPYSDKRREVTISGQIPEIKSIVVFMPIDDLNRALETDEDFFNVYFSDEEMSFEDEVLLTTIDRESVGQFLEHFLNNFSRAGFVVSTISISVYFMFMYVLGKLIIEKSKVNISYLKVFGFNTSEIAGIYINSIRNAVFVYLLLIVPLLDLLCRKLITLSLLKFDLYIEVDIPYRIYGIAVGMGFVLYVLVQFLQTRKISKMNMAEGLKNAKG